MTLCRVYDIGENCRSIGVSAIRIFIPSDESLVLPEKNAWFLISLLMHTNRYEVQYSLSIT